MSEPMSKQKKTTKATSARDIRRARARRAAIRFGFWVGIPTALAIVYYGFIAAPQYESVAVVTIQSQKDRPTLDGLAAIIAPTGSGRDAMLVREYVHSRDMLDLLDDKHDLVAHYKSDKADFWSRLDDDASTEETFEYFREKVKVSAGGASGTLTVKVRAFDADKAAEVAQGIIDAAEAMVNKVTERARRDQLRVAEDAVAKSEERLKSARAALLKLMGDHTTLDPKAAAAAVNTITVELEGQLATARAELDALSAVMKRNAPKVVAARKKVGSLAYQLERQRKKLVGSKSGSVKTSLADLEPAMLEKELAQKAYETSIKTLEIARIEASRQVRYLVTISAPSRPDAPTHPRRAWSIGTVFVVSLLLMGIGTLLLASVREHAKF